MKSFIVILFIVIISGKDLIEKNKIKLKNTDYSRLEVLMIYSFGYVNYINLKTFDGLKNYLIVKILMILYQK